MGSCGNLVVAENLASFREPTLSEFMVHCVSQRQTCSNLASSLDMACVDAIKESDKYLDLSANGTGDFVCAINETGPLVPQLGGSVNGNEYTGALLREKLPQNECAYTEPFTKASQSKVDAGDMGTNGYCLDGNWSLAELELRSYLECPEAEKELLLPSALEESLWNSKAARDDIFSLFGMGEDMELEVGTGSQSHPSDGIIPLEACEITELASDSSCAKIASNLNVYCNGIDEKLVNLQSFQPPSAVDSSLEKLCNPNHVNINVTSGINYSSVTDLSGKSVNAAADISRVDQVSEFIYPNGVCAESQRSIQTRKSGCKIEVRLGAIKCRNRTVRGGHEISESVFKVSRRKRSCLSKPARSSMWGSLDKFSWVSELGSGVTGHQGGNCSRKGMGESSEDIRQTCHPSKGCIRLKIKFNNGVGQRSLEVVAPKLDDALAPGVNLITDDHRNNLFKDKASAFSRLDSGVEENSGDERTGKEIQALMQKPTRIQLCSDGSNILHAQPLPLSGETSHGVSRDCLNVEFGKHNEMGSMDSEAGLYQSGGDKELLQCKENAHKVPRKVKSGKDDKVRSKSSNARGGRRGAGSRQSGTKIGTTVKSKVKDAGIGGNNACEVDGQREEGNHMPNAVEKTSATVNIVSNLDLILEGALEQYVPPSNAWVNCDDCHKWRRISPSLLESIENYRWVCKDNMDKVFADCSIPQEKSNREINEELGIPDGLYAADASDACLNIRGLESRPKKRPNDGEFAAIEANEYIYRSRKTQTIDEIMVCHCKPPQAGSMGCGGECLNRMLNIECVQGTCACGDLCSNQQFQRRQWVNLQWFRCGKKGFGLQSLEDISQGQFLIEYVGEVLDMHAYEGRQKEYARNGHKHFYFMALNGNEVIDACVKGNLGRFINHSCEPNCRTEKVTRTIYHMIYLTSNDLDEFLKVNSLAIKEWMVNGEICIGLFAMRNIKKGEELTFDYNYVRVYGAAAKKCYCGSGHCRGYIGGDPLGTEVVVYGDSDEEYPEPVMVCKVDGCVVTLSSAISSCSANTVETKTMKLNEKLEEPGVTAGQPDITTEAEKSMNAVASVSAVSQLYSSADVEDLDGKLISSKPAEMLLQTDDATSETKSAIQKLAEPSGVGQLGITTGPEKSMNGTASAASQLISSQSDEIQEQPDYPTIKTSSTVQEMSTEEQTMKKVLCSTQALPLSLTAPLLKFSSDFDAARKSKSNASEKRQVSLKSNPHMKSHHTSSFVKRKQVITSRDPVLPAKSRKSLEGSSCSHFEAVEEKLNELLDANGGISKREDAAKGYLKLLLLTAASGDRSNGEAIQSNRDLSMILDALLKTKSRVVLTDIIKKNGLRMLHNMMKHYRRDLKKIPILRKLMKVLEYLAFREILTLEHIKGGPPFPGMESFKASMLSLTKHEDRQVHQIARSFRDRWIPRPNRKICCLVKDDGRLDSIMASNCARFPASQSHWHDNGTRSTEEIDCVEQAMFATPLVDSGAPEGHSVPCRGGNSTNGMKTRKRKSRWDQPAEVNPESKFQYHEAQINNYDRKSTLKNQETLEEVPPGFSPPIHHHMVPSCALRPITDLYQSNGSHLRCPMEVSIGSPQARFKSCLPVSYGIPLTIVEEVGNPQAGNVEGWVIAPGMPFSPFPPLPPFPCNKKNQPPSWAANTSTIKKIVEGRWDSHGPATFGGSSAYATGATLQARVDLDNQHIFKRPRDFSGNYGRRCFKRRKWNNRKFECTWLREKNR